MDENSALAITRYNNSGPKFGADLHITATGAHSSSDFGKNYKLPSGYTYAAANTRALLAGNYHFTPSEVEVLYLN